MSGADLVLGIVGLALTLMVFSYILKDNVFFGIALYLLVGVSSGYATLLIIRSVILPMLVSPLLMPGTQSFYLALVPLILSVLFVFMLFKRGSRMGRIPLAFLVGVMVAMALFGVSRGTLAPQLLSVFQYFSPGAVAGHSTIRWWGLLEAIAIFLGVVAVLAFFQERQRKMFGKTESSVVLTGMSKLGQVFLGITFGALFVGLLSSALIALIGNLTTIVDFFRTLLGG
ncbi:MAG TPA: hypothetical protein PK459_00945 [Anaerolineaceae bacterium]|nr:hypothetical protein [Anaerolineaceae bacterium]HQC63647.1 hypothetical protein [Anaerolineaceae bacterium]